MATEASGALPQAARERRFYTRMAWFVVVLVFIGFAPSFYLKPFDVISFPRPNPPLVPNLMTHGLMFSTWVALFVVQVSLVSAGRRDLHRTLGAATLVLGVAMVPAMYLTAIWSFARGSAPPFTDPLTWTAISLSPIPIYVATLWLGWRESRRDLQAHKRIMLGLMLMLTEPATHRLPLLPPSLMNNNIHLVLCLLVFVPLIVWDLRTMGRLHWATKLVGGLFVLVIALQMSFLSVPGLWAGFARHLPGLGS